MLIKWLKLTMNVVKLDAISDGDTITVLKEISSVLLTV